MFEDLTADLDEMRTRCMRTAVTAVLAVAVSACGAPVKKGYEIHTADLSCEEANRLVYDSLVDMQLRVTTFRPAKPGRPGLLRVKPEPGSSRPGGEVRISCEDGEVHVVSSQSGLSLQSQQFERGVFLGVTGRADLEVEREGRRTTGRVKKRDRTPPVQTDSAGSSQTSSAAPAGAGRAQPAPTAQPKDVGIVVRLKPLRGFATVLDFEADLSAAGILPVKVSISNATKRAYEFDPRDIVLRKRGSRDRAQAMTASEAVKALEKKNREVLGGGAAQASDETGPFDPRAPSSLGDVRAAADVIVNRSLRGSRLQPGAKSTGFVYFPLADYDRARIIMIDVATGETEGFLVEF
jgi:hypothetical protein